VISPANLFLSMTVVTTDPAGKTVDYTGNVGIGTANPAYKLAVEGTIGARDIIVTNTPWSDYVFQPATACGP
jgi:hypothetical protein